MKASGKITKCMAKVKKKWIFYDLLILISLFDDSIGKMLWNNGDKYEGEWKDDKKHG